MILSSTDDIIRVTTADAADIEVYASWVDVVAGVITPGRTNTASLTSSTDAIVVAAPGSSTTYRNVKLLSFRNNHATQECTVTVEHYDGSIYESLMKVVLRAGEALLFDALGRWSHYTSNGEIYAACQPAATQAQMEAATVTTATVVPSVQVFHPGHPKMWAKFGVAANILASYNTTSIADDGTGLATVTIATDFSSTDWVCETMVERASTTLTVANARECPIRSNTQAAGTIQVECYDHTAAGPALADPASWHILGMGDQA